MLINREVRTVLAALNITRDAAKIPARAKSPKNLIKRGPSEVTNPLEKLIKLVGIINRRRVFVSGRKEGFRENLFLCFGVINRIKTRDKNGASKILNPASLTSIVKKWKKAIKAMSIIEYSKSIDIALSFNSLKPCKIPLMKSNEKYSTQLPRKKM